ncbi:MAG: CopG family transcriptional regulator [Anaerolineae bacterium]|jgi:metal-responsive CopG/Arc/MetJ family transcriptional regulator
MRRTTVMLPEEDWLELKKLAQRQGRSPSEMIREAVAAYVTEAAEEQRTSFVGLGTSGRSDVSRQPDELLGKA